MKITALSNQKPGILNNYITSSKYSYIISQLSRMHGKLDSSFPSVHLNFPLVVFLFFTLIQISVMTSYLVSDFHFSVTTCNIVFRYLNFSDIANEHIIPPIDIVRVILLWAYPSIKPCVAIFSFTLRWILFIFCYDYYEGCHIARIFILSDFFESYVPFTPVLFLLQTLDIRKNSNKNSTLSII